MRVDIDENYLLIKGQGHRVKGQGQIFGFMKKLFVLITHELIVGLKCHLAGMSLQIFSH